MKISFNFHTFIITAMLTISGACYAEEQENMNDGYTDDAVSICEKEAESSENPDIYLQECIDKHLYPEETTQQESGDQQ